MKPRISLFSILLIPTAFAGGWWLGGRGAESRLAAIEEQYAKKSEGIESVAAALNAATFINTIYETTERLPADEQLHRRHTLLIMEILSLARAEPFKTKNQEEVFLMHANHAMDLLRVNHSDEFRTEVQASSLVESVKSIFEEPLNAEHRLVTDFVRRTFAYRMAQPSYPGRVWVDAISKRDSDLLESAFSTRLRNEAGDWSERLSAYSSKLHESLGDVNACDFRFSFSVGMDEGEVSILWKEKEHRTRKIVKEQDGWKLDEW